MTNALAVTHSNAGSYDILPTSTTDERLIAMWLDAEDKNAATQDAYARDVRQFLQAVSLPLQAVTLADLQAWQETLTGKPATVKRKIGAVRSLFSFAQRTGYLRLNPAVMLSVPKVADTKHRKVAQEREIMRMLDVATGVRDGALLYVLYSSGARVSEVLALTWQDVQPRSKGGAVLHIVSGKGGKQRQAAISAGAYEALIDMRTDETQETDFVFSTRNGTALDRHAAHRALKSLAKRAGVSDDFSAHWLRHSHATHALARGSTLPAVQEQLGHSSQATTSQYAHADRYSADALAL